ncbi:MAG: ribonuclease P protein component [Candidatus Paceibacterota bacterium]|jgi:ribonuclease P protein component
MLPKKNRANKKAIDQIFQKGRFFSSSNLTFKFILNKNTNQPMISFIVPKTVVKKAIVRNLLRRRGYAVLEKYIKDFPVSMVGAFIFGKKSLEVFGKRKNKNYNPILNLKNEIKIIINKIH